MKYSKTLALPTDSNNLKKIKARIETIKHNIANNELTTLVIEATSICNLQCNYCGMHSRAVSTKDKELQTKGRKFLKEQRHMDLDLFRETIRKCQGLEKFKILYLHGDGEPLLNPNLIKMIEIAKKADVAEQIVLITNGVLLTGDVFRGLVKAGVVAIRISLDVISPAKFLKIKGVDAGKRVLKNVEACVEIMRKEHLPVEFIILCAKHDPKNKDMSREADKIIKHFEKKIRGVPNVEIRYRKIFDWVGTIRRIADGGEYCRVVSCEQPFYVLMVHADGDISVCCGDTTKDVVVGQISKVRSLKQILSSNLLRQIRISLLEQDYDKIPACRYCGVSSEVDRELLSHKQKLLKLLKK